MRSVLAGLDVRMGVASFRMPTQGFHLVGEASNHPENFSLPDTDLIWNRV